MHQAGWVLVVLVIIVPDVGVLEGASHGDVTDQKGLDLGGCCYGNCNRDSSHIDLGVDDLNLEGGVAAEYSVGGDFESVEESGGLDCAFKVRSEG